ncbi:tetratricopeptide repeat protein [Actinomadura litoris]|uniref:Tetratricopeptide repeat protein n=1 Tax=Actinomadura litoris TaxID=2678616 RepID=A0A7K1L909_9ACTN|nr:tetratricopeptide repeat protein [Actinomadura litoris]MUN40919.1 tetratricopeptide repeat protein [Actinomadura litoris]
MPQTRNQISGGIVVGPAILGRDITVILPPQIPMATSGLPAGSPTFTGRQRDLDRLLDSLKPPGPADQTRDERARAVVVTAVGGLAGVGKTELAVQAARTALGRDWFPGGVLFADLFGYDEDRRRDPGQVLEGMLGALGVPGEHIPAHAQDRSRLYRSILAEFAAHGQRILIIADNIDTPQQGELLLPADGVNAAILTFRHTLAMLNARLLDLNVLDVDGAVAMLDAALRIADPHDTRIPAGLVGAAQLAEVCGFLPLALRIAAALLAEDPALTPAVLTGELQQVQPIDGLAYGDEGVRRAFELSYRSPTPHQQQLFRLLTLNPGPDISTTAAAALTAQPEPAVRAVLKEMARAHLIERGTAPGRWRMHDLVRQYANTLSLQHAEVDHRDQALHRLLRHYTVTARAAVAHLNPTVEDPVAGGFGSRWQALAWLDIELPHLAAAAHTAADVGHSAVAIVLPLELAFFLNWRRLFSEWITMSSLARDTAKRIGNRDGEGAALNNLGLALVEVRRFEEAITAHQDAVAVFRETGDRNSEGTALNNLGVALRQARQSEDAFIAYAGIAFAYQDPLPEVERFEEAVSAYRQHLAVCREAGNLHGEATALNDLGIALQQTGAVDDAIYTYQDALTLYHRTGDRRGEGQTLNNLGIALRQVRRFEEAVNAHRQGLAICRRTGDRRGEGQTLNNLGIALRQTRRVEEAVTAHQNAIILYHETGDRHSEAMALNNLGIALRLARRFGEAVNAHRQGLAICRQTGDRQGEGRALTNLGIVLRGVRRFEEAIKAGQAAVTIFAMAGDEYSEAVAHATLEESIRASTTAKD